MSRYTSPWAFLRDDAATWRRRSRAARVMQPPQLSGMNGVRGLYGLGGVSELGGKVASAAWSPATLTPDVWYTPDVTPGLISYANTDPISPWSTSYGSSNDATNTGSNRPTCKTGAVNGFKGVQFDGASHQTLTLTTEKVYSGDFAICGAMHRPSGKSLGAVTGEGTAPSPFDVSRILFASDNTVVINDHDGNGSAVANPINGDGVWLCYRSGSTVYLTTTGMAPIPFATGVTGDFKFAQMGWDARFSNYSDTGAYLSELFSLGRVLTAPELANLRAYLLAKYAVTLSRDYSLTFAGSQYVVSGSNVGISGDATFSQGCWLYLADTSTTSCALSFGDSGTALGACGIFANVRGAGVISVEFAGNTPAISAAGGLSAGSWHYVLAVKTPGAISSTTKIFVDGVDYGLAGGSSGSTPNLLNSTATVGGFNPTGTSVIFFAGNIAYPFIYAGDLSSEATALAAGASPSLSTVFYKLREGPGSSTIADSSGNSNTGTLNGPPTWSPSIPPPLWPDIN